MERRGFIKRLSGGVLACALAPAVTGCGERTPEEAARQIASRPTVTAPPRFIGTPAEQSRTRELAVDDVVVGWRIESRREVRPWDPVGGRGPDVGFVEMGMREVRVFVSIHGWGPQPGHDVQLRQDERVVAYATDIRYEQLARDLLTCEMVFLIVAPFELDVDALQVEGMPNVCRFPFEIHEVTG